MLCTLLRACMSCEMSEKDPLAAFRRVNVDGTENLLTLSGMSGVKGLIYLSTVKIHGDMTSGKPLFSNGCSGPS